MADYICKHCGKKAQKYGTICPNCYRRLKLIREIKAIGKVIKKKAGRE